MRAISAEQKFQEYKATVCTDDASRTFVEQGARAAPSKIFSDVGHTRSQLAVGDQALGDPRLIASHMPHPSREGRCWQGMPWNRATIIARGHLRCSWLRLSAQCLTAAMLCHRKKPSLMLSRGHRSRNGRKDRLINQRFERMCASGRPFLKRLARVAKLFGWIPILSMKHPQPR